VFIWVTNGYNSGRFVNRVTLSALQSALQLIGFEMSQPFKDPFNFLYFIGFLLVLMLPTLPVTLSWLKHAGLI
jgi:hypothetical protein